MTRLTPAPPTPILSRLKHRLSSKAKRYLHRFAWGCGVGLIQLALALSPTATKPSPAADKITFSLGATIDRSISVESLEIYVSEGRITEELKPYIDYIERIDRVFVVEQNRDAQLRTLLTTDLQLDPAKLEAVLHYDGMPLTAANVREPIVRKLATGQAA